MKKKLVYNMDSMTDSYQNIDELIISFIKGELDDAGKLELERWVTASGQNREHFVKSCQVWLATGLEAYRDHFDIDDAFSEFKLIHGRAMKRPRPVWSLYAAIAAAAACIAIVFGISYNLGRRSLKNELQEIVAEAPLGSNLKMTLPDGSRIQLNAGSSVRYSQGFGVVDRRISLTGECYFEVAPNEEVPFVVSTRDLDVKVVGTKFNFRDYPNDLEAIVSLLEGKVELGNRLRQDGDRRYLNPGQRVILDKHVGEMRIETKNAQNSIQWTQGNLFFDEELLPDITKELERYYNVKIDIHGDRLRKLRIFGNIIPREMTIEEVLETLSATNRIDYTIDGGNVTLSEHI